MLNSSLQSKFIQFNNFFFKSSLNFKKLKDSKILLFSYQFNINSRNFKFKKVKTTPIINIRGYRNRKYYMLKNRHKFRFYFRRRRINKGSKFFNFSSITLFKPTKLIFKFLKLPDFNFNRCNITFLNQIPLILKGHYSSKISIYFFLRKRLCSLFFIYKWPYTFFKKHRSSSLSKFFQKCKFKRRMKLRRLRRKFFNKFIRFWRYTSKILFLRYTSLYSFKIFKVYKIFKLCINRYRSSFNRYKLKLKFSVITPKLSSFNRFVFKNLWLNSLTKGSICGFGLFFFNLKLVRNFFLKNMFSENNLFVSTFLKTNHKVNFILHSVGLLLPLKFTYKLQKHINLYILKKKAFSFLRRNEYKMHIFNIRKKYMKWQSFLCKKLPRMNFTRFKSYNFFKYEFLTNLDIFNKKFLQNVFLNEKILGIGRSYNLYSKSSVFYFGEVRIPRVRFKPGYQRLWRGYRQALAELVGFKYVYQGQLTKYLTHFYRKLNQSFISDGENLAFRVLIYSRLVPDLNSFNIFFKNKMIFLNNFFLFKADIYVYKNDYIQLEISNWYYVFFRWLSSFSKNRQLRLRRLVFRKSLPSRYQLMKQRKQRSNYTPNWIISTEYDFKDIKAFLEVDFMTLSVFLIYDYREFFYHTPIDARIVTYNIYKMYNWKYIT